MFYLGLIPAGEGARKRRALAKGMQMVTIFNLHDGNNVFTHFPDLNVDYLDIWDPGLILPYAVNIESLMNHRVSISLQHLVSTHGTGILYITYYTHHKYIHFICTCVYMKLLNFSIYNTLFLKHMHISYSAISSAGMLLNCPHLSF